MSLREPCGPDGSGEAGRSGCVVTGILLDSSMVTPPPLGSVDHARRSTLQTERHEDSRRDRLNSLARAGRRGWPESHPSSAGPNLRPSPGRSSVAASARPSSRPGCACGAAVRRRAAPLECPKFVVAPRSRPCVVPRRRPPRTGPATRTAGRRDVPEQPAVVLGILAHERRLVAAVHRLVSEPRRQRIRGGSGCVRTVSTPAARRSVAIVRAQVSPKPSSVQASQQAKPYRPSASSNPLT